MRLLVPISVTALAGLAAVLGGLVLHETSQASLPDEAQRLRREVI